MFKWIRNNQKKVLAGLSILSMVMFVANRGNGSDHTAADHVYGTVGGKPINFSEVSNGRAEVSALKTYLDYSKQPIDEQGRLENQQAAFIHELVSIFSAKADTYVLLLHEAEAAGVQVSNDEIESVMANYTQDLDPKSDAYYATRAGVTGLLKIIARYEQIAGMLKISKPAADLALVEQDENIQLDLLQLKAADYLSKVPAPTTQQLQDQFAQYAGIAPHKPTPTTNPFGFGYRLPLRARLQYIRLSPDAVNAAVVATKSAYDWEVQAKKYYLTHLSEFPTTEPATAPAGTIAPPGSQPFKAVQDKILSDIREPLTTALMDQVQHLIDSTLSTDWQAYSQFIASGKPGPEPVSSLGVPFTSFDYLTKLAEKVQSRFKVTITVNQTPEALSREQIAALPGVGTPAVAEAAITQAEEYLKAVDSKDAAAPAQLVRFSTQAGSDDISHVIYRLSEALPSEPAPSLASVATQADSDLRTAAAYKLAEAAAKEIVAQIKDRPLLLKDRPLALAATAQNPVVHIDHLSMQSDEIPEIKPPLSGSQRSFTEQAFQLLQGYDPGQNLYPAEVIALPEQARVFAAKLSFVEAGWDSNDFFVRTLQTRWRQRATVDQRLIRPAWFDYGEVAKRVDFKPAGKNTGA